MNSLIADTGPIVALLNPSDAHHAWAKECFKALDPPLLTCDAVLCEAFFLLRRFTPGKRVLLKMMAGGGFTLQRPAEEPLDRVAKLLQKYEDTPMDFADACLVDMVETHRETKVWTVDSDFRVYRLSNRRMVPVLAPWSQS
ncbi:type II toxin-antitoxin system VapC family toxin [Haloferula rosea]|uniref:PIN domain-containing protein n=1 Tax=Haloferula rosea TaxID=490093 RepID=A0A934VF79_9BACT|nr:PIN domain-containing protein [Haloferula rosea]MBK1826786.1 PIN domain-containing protein [Haloferula rosea]